MANTTAGSEGEMEMSNRLRYDEALKLNRVLGDVLNLLDGTEDFNPQTIRKTLKDVTKVRQMFYQRIILGRQHNELT